MKNIGESEDVRFNADAPVCKVKPSEIQVYDRGKFRTGKTTVSVLPCGVQYIEGSFQVHCDGSNCPTNQSKNIVGPYSMIGERNLLANNMPSITPSSEMSYQK